LLIKKYFGEENMCIIEKNNLGKEEKMFEFYKMLVYMVWKWKRNGMSVIKGIDEIYKEMR
jgi:hypothetical protein